MDKSIIAANVRAERARRRLTLTELARLTGLTRQTISNIENEVHEPTLESMSRIAKAMGLTLRVLAEPPLIAA